MNTMERYANFWVLGGIIFGIIALYVEYYAIWLPIPDVAIKPSFPVFFALFGFWIWLVGMAVFVLVADTALELPLNDETWSV